MSELDHLFGKNRAWAERMRAGDAEFFAKLSRQQSPEYLWIGCSDSRVPANEIVGLLPGELFVHRNLGNVVVHTDLNCLSVLQFAVDVLRVRHIMVVGHYGCSAIHAALARHKIGLSDNWLRHIQDVHRRHESLIKSAADQTARSARLCELNVVEQVVNVCGTTVVREAWDRGQKLAVHGWVYGLHDGLLRDLEVTTNSGDLLPQRYAGALAGLTQSPPAPAEGDLAVGEDKS
jgi:carbonic anhydrase